MFNYLISVQQNNNHHQYSPIQFSNIGTTLFLICLFYALHVFTIVITIN